MVAPLTAIGLAAVALCVAIARQPLTQREEYTARMRAYRRARRKARRS